MIKLLVTTAVVLCTFGTVNAAELTPDQELIKARSALINPQPQYVALSEDRATLIDPRTGQPVEHATDLVYGLEYCGGNPQPNYCPEADPNLARLMFNPQSIAEWDQTKARQWYWAQYRAKHPLTTADGEAAPIGLVGEPFPPGNEQVAQGGIGSDYVAQARADRAQNCPQPTAEADARECSGQQQQVAVPLPQPNPLKAYAKAPRTRMPKHR
jgi:hypothetical protein